MTFEHFDNENGLKGGCFYSALMFSKIENEISGQYFCIVKPSLNFNPSRQKGLQKKITVLSGADVP